MAPLDIGFIHRVYRTSAWVTLLVMAGVGQRWGWHAALGIAVGSAVQLVSIYVIERGARRFIVPGAESVRPFFLYGAAFYPALLVVLWFVVRCSFISLEAVAAGVLVPIVVIVLKVLGGVLLARLPEDGSSTQPPRTAKETKE